MVRPAQLKARSEIHLPVNFNQNVGPPVVAAVEYPPRIWCVPSEGANRSKFTVTCEASLTTEIALIRNAISSSTG